MGSEEEKWGQLSIPRLMLLSPSQNKLDEALLTSGRVADALNSMLEWLVKVQSSLGEDQPILGDLDTVSMLIEQHKALQQELSAREQTVAAIKSCRNLPPIQLEELNNLWESVNMLSELREARLKESLHCAEEFQSVVQVMREFLPHAEAELKTKSLPEDETVIMQLIEKHEKFQAELRDHADCIEKIKFLAEEILLNCHPNAIRFVKYYLTITQTRWDQLLQRAKSKEQKFQEALQAIQNNAALVEELLSWLTDAQMLLTTKEKDPIPDDINVVETLCKEHSEFHEDINSKSADIERLTKILQHEPKSPAIRSYGSQSKLSEFEGHNSRVLALQNKWRTVWRMSVDRKKILEDALDTLMENESVKNFDFELWKSKYFKWMNAKKMRMTDFFRRQDRDGDGFLSRDEFVNGMITSGFKTNKTELNAVFDIFDRENRDFIEYQEFVESMKPKRHQKERLKGNNKMMSDIELIHDEIDREVALCSCRSPLRVEMVDTYKYKFGEKNAIKLVRYLNSTVMVRVGGGWITLDEFLETNDPCRARARNSIALSTTSDGADMPTSAHGETTFRSRSGSGTYGYKSPKNSDPGYTSSVSSAGSSGKTSLRRSKPMTTSMVNLSGNTNSKFVNSLCKQSDFGSSGNLACSKWLSNSSSNISPTKPCTPLNTSLNTPRYLSPRQPPARSTTPQPSIAFGRSTIPISPRSSTSTSRATTTLKVTLTRPGQQTSSGRTTPSPGHTTPIISSGLRRLPTTPKQP